MKQEDLVRVAVPLPLWKAYSYRVTEEHRNGMIPGVRVLVPFGTRHLIGVVLGAAEEEPEVDYKEILGVLDGKPVMSPGLLQLAEWISWYYFAPLGEVLQTMLPPGLLMKKASPDESPDSFWPAKTQLAVTGVRPANRDLTPRQEELLQFLRDQELPVLVQDLIREKETSHGTLRAMEDRGVLEIRSIDIFRSPWSQLRVDSPVRHRLSQEQDAVCGELCAALEKGGFARCLVHGVTASGKTEIYLNAIQEVLRQGRSALVLVPEIGLTPQLSRQFRAWFGKLVAILHSRLSEGERFDQWRRIRSREARVVIGTRSAVFAPLEDLALIVVDEEHDQSYKQERLPRYNARDTAVKRAQMEGCVVVLGSATPQLETFYNARRKEIFTYLPLKERILNRRLPDVHIVDMREEFQRRGKAPVFSTLLEEKMRDRLEAGAQILVLLNRRGYSRFLMCRSCGHTLSCVHCSITLTYHQGLRRLVCHYCGYGRSVPEDCGECGRSYIHYVGEGTEQVEEILTEKFPRSSIGRLDRDTVRRKGALDRILQDFRQEKTEILVGTQMIAKGHDFPGVTLVGVLAADQGLKLADFRSAERTFQLLTQVAGRAGRGEVPGEVVVQTYHPLHYSLRYASTQQYDSFAEKEIEFRRRFRYPPFTALANFLVKDRDLEVARQQARRLVKVLTEERDRISDRRKMRILGPAPAVIERIKKDYRMQVLVKTVDRGELHEVLRRAWSKLDPTERNRRIAVDIDPMNLL